MDTLSWIVVATSVLVLGGFVIAFSAYRRRLERLSATRSRAAEEASRHLPPSLHPVIDPDICIGSLSCITACPEGDILGIVDGTAKLIVGSNCIGHGRCAIECPVGAIKLVFGTSERGVDLPSVDANFETNRRGVHVVGELGGMGLIKNAITQGVQAVQFIASGLKGDRSTDALDVAIVGAGPAGLAAALGCIDAGLSYRVFEQGRVGGAMAQYPRHKIVMSETVRLPGWGKFGRATLSKEALLGEWQKIIDKTKMHISEDCRVVGITGGDGAFALDTSRGAVKARKVLLAIGRRGTPRRLDVPGDALEHVTYSLLEPEQYKGCKVAVVGGGDTAIEAALALAEQPGTRVTICHRGDAFTKCRDENRRKISALIDSGRVRALFAAQPSEVTPQLLLLTHHGEQVEVEADYVVACLGGEMPTAFLQQIGISFETHRGERAQRSPAVAGKHEERSTLAWWLFGLGTAIVATLTTAGFSYYKLDPSARELSPLHEAFRPAGHIGHGIGVIATLFMLSNFLYPLRKRLGWFKGSAPIRSWLTVHMFVGLMSPLVIVFHAAFQSKNLLATSTFAALLVVVVTGGVGRFVYGLLPKSADAKAELSLLSAQMQRHQRVIAEAGGEKKQTLQRLLEPLDTSSERRGSLLFHLARIPFDRIAIALAVSGLSADGAAKRALRETARALLSARTQVAFYARLRRLMSVWRVLHIGLALFLVIVIAIHVVVSILIGYRWIFST